MTGSYVTDLGTRVTASEVEAARLRVARGREPIDPAVYAIANARPAPVAPEAER